MNKPPLLQAGDTIGIFTPSTPAYLINEEKFQLGVKVLEDLGFIVRIGSLTKDRGNQGYRSGTAKARAKEFMELYRDPEVKGLISTIGGYNSSSMIPHLDYDFIQKNPKMVCGYSDVTSLHLALLHYGKLRSFYGPAVMTWFSEFPCGEESTLESFKDAVCCGTSRNLKPFPRWSNHFREWSDGSWKSIEREWVENKGWKVLNPGEAEGEALAFNLNTLVSNAGTPHYPQFDSKILIVEEMASPFSQFERNMSHLKLTGALENLKALIFGKPEFLKNEGAEFTHDDLIEEIIGPRDYPIITEFDLSHTAPMHTICQLDKVRIKAQGDYDVSFEILEH